MLRSLEHIKGKLNTAVETQHSNIKGFRRNAEEERRIGLKGRIEERKIRNELRKWKFHGLNLLCKLNINFLLIQYLLNVFMCQAYHPLNHCTNIYWASTMHLTLWQALRIHTKENWMCPLKAILSRMPLLSIVWSSQGAHRW